MYNPPEDWEKTLLVRYIDFSKVTGQCLPLLLINDGSSANVSDAVHFLSEQLGDRFNYLSYPKNLGKGGALKYGASHANTSKYIFTDIDFPYDPESMKSIMTKASLTDGIVIGQRDQHYYAEMTPLRIMLSKGLKWLNKIILRLPTNDTQCGLKAFDNNAKNILLSCHTNRFLIDLEFLLAANKSKILITPVPVQLRKEIDFTAFDTSVLLKETLNFIKLIIKYRM